MHFNISWYFVAFYIKYQNYFNWIKCRLQFLDWEAFFPFCFPLSLSPTYSALHIITHRLIKFNPQNAEVREGFIKHIICPSLGCSSLQVICSFTDACGPFVLLLIYWFNPSGQTCIIHDPQLSLCINKFSELYVCPLTGWLSSPILLHFNKEVNFSSSLLNHHKCDWQVLNSS